MGFDEERSDEVREQRERNPHAVSNPNFCKTQKLPKQKEKAMAGKIYFPKPLIAFCRDYSRFKKENGISNGIRTHVAGMRTRCPRPLDDGDTFLTQTKYIAKHVDCQARLRIKVENITK